mmetsp:Transcript_39043/g.82112  ORF Transcript_39043/g.82112 Transcript_39043/m.82112 type:complete len:305 (-) Transcript_39043:463-1377(-)|eukprot:CAMPEP_0183730536 /NCGR_PEP_ID=MMETSP0737-20130205/33091_1 /TAXON_ID=385413 /ORGANISM="Thalassiosira miniscula, Strain CCMP1093" /LENGTH=304 /DNA_ID=CAMNT_0025963059 /DNA_START=264 /DNA_END=1178 /DNA_ORIENTATION=-
MSHSTLDTDYFINKNNANISSGYWEPHTSSIDFCETNYLLSNKVVEPHNVWSSLLGLSLFGLIGILYGNPTRERRFIMINSILILIGLGSTCLHATLHWYFQSTDELPMLYLAIGALYIILEIDSPPTGKGEMRFPHLAKYLLLLGCINTAVYYRFQHLYIIFLATFVVMLIAVASQHIQIAWRLHQENKDETKKIGNNCSIALRLYIWHYIFLLVVAVPVWVLDQFHCEHLLPLYNNLPYPFKGMTFHVVWHVCAGLGAYLVIQFLAATRANSLGLMVDTRYVLGVIPVVVLKSKKNGAVKHA